MPSLAVYPIRALKRKLKVQFLSFKEIPECLVVSPGGCGSNTLVLYLNKYIKSNIYFEKKYKFFGLSHIYKPNFFLKKNKTKIILINRNFENIYNSLMSRGFIRNSLNLLGDLFPFVYINIFKNNKYLKQKFYKYLELFYSNWSDYDKKYILNIEYDYLYKNKKAAILIKKFLDIKNPEFTKNFPKYKKYNKKKNFVDPSSVLSKKIYNL
jgi:hypothetical protein